MTRPSMAALRIIDTAMERRQSVLLQRSDRTRVMRDYMYLVVEVLLLDLCLERFRATFQYIERGAQGSVDEMDALFSKQAVLPDGRILWFVGAQKRLKCKTYRQVFCQAPRIVVSASLMVYLEHLHKRHSIQLCAYVNDAIENKDGQVRSEETLLTLQGIWRLYGQEALHIPSDDPAPLSDASLKSCPLLVRTASSKGKMNISSSQSPRENEHVETQELGCYDIPNALAFSDDGAMMQSASLAILGHWAMLAAPSQTREERCNATDDLLTKSHTQHVCSLVEIALHVSLLMRFDVSPSSETVNQELPCTIASSNLSHALALHVIRTAAGIREESESNKSSYFEALKLDKQSLEAPHLGAVMGKIRFVFLSWSTAKASHAFLRGLASQGILVPKATVHNTAIYVARLLDHFRVQLHALGRVLRESARPSPNAPIASRSMPVDIPKRETARRGLPAPLSCSPLDEGRSESATTSDDESDVDDELAMAGGGSLESTSPFEVGSPMHVQWIKRHINTSTSPERRVSSPTVSRTAPKNRPTPKKNSRWQDASLKKTRRRLVSSPDTTLGGRRAMNNRKK